MLAVIVDQATRQLIGEVETETQTEVSPHGEASNEVRPRIDSQGFTLVKNPLLFGEMVKGTHISQAMMPLFQTVTVSEVKVRIAEYFFLGEKETNTRIAYEKVLQEYRFRQSGLVTATQIPKQ